jgi:hypothetical protein
MSEASESTSDSSDAEDAAARRRFASVAVTGAFVASGAEAAAKRATTRYAGPAGDEPAQRQAALLLHRHLEETIVYGEHVSEEESAKVKRRRLRAEAAEGDDSSQPFALFSRAVLVLLPARAPSPTRQLLSPAEARRAAKPRRRNASDSDDEGKRNGRCLAVAVDADFVEELASKARAKAAAALAAQSGTSPTECEEEMDTAEAAAARRKARRKAKKLLRAAAARGEDGHTVEPLVPPAGPRTAEAAALVDEREPAPPSAKLSQREKKKRRLAAAQLAAQKQAADGSG